MAIVAGTYILLSILVISNKTVLYTTSVLPMLCILAAVNTDELLRVPRVIGERIRRIFHSGYFRESLGIGLFVLLSLNQLAGDAKLLWRNRNCSYTETIKQLQTVIPPDARVWGSITFWFGFQHQPLRTQYTHLREVDTFKPRVHDHGGRRNMGKGFLEIRAGRCGRGHRKTGDARCRVPGKLLRHCGSTICAGSPLLNQTRLFVISVTYMTLTADSL